LVGEEGVGKTAFLLRFLNGEFFEDDDPTLGKMFPDCIAVCQLILFALNNSKLMWWILFIIVQITSAPLACTSSYTDPILFL
jgi:hypothetical protein